MTTKLSKIPDSIQKAYQEAVKAKANSYSPYSNFAVGAALKFVGDDQLYQGTNVENISFGGTICAERSAVCSRVSQKGQADIEFVVVVTNTQTPTPPCALCLQFMSEFGKKDFPIYMGNDEGLTLVRNFKEFLPYSFETLSEGQRKD